jgi:hypothetical protein
MVLATFENNSHKNVKLESFQKLPIKIFMILFKYSLKKLKKQNVAPPYIPSLENSLEIIPAKRTLEN